MSPQLLAMLRSGQQPLDAYRVPHLVPRLSAALSRILQSCHSQYAAATLTRCGFMWRACAAETMARSGCVK